jgi:hypothetical protein
MPGKSRWSSLEPRIVADRSFQFLRVLAHQLHWLMLALVLEVCSIASATTIVALAIDKKTILIGADGIVIGQSKATGNPNERVPFCKVRCVGHSCFAASGRYDNDTIRYDLFKMGERELRRNIPPEMALNHLRKKVLQIMPRLLLVSRQETPLAYSRWLEGRPVIAFLFCGFDAYGIPTIVNWQVRLNSSGEVIREEGQSKRGGEEQVRGTVLGWSENIAAYMTQTPEWAQHARTDPIKTVRDLIEIEISASETAGRRDVGEPICIVTLTAEGFHLDAPDACKAQ